MCCVITIPGTPCGSRGRILAMASVPPVEAPMAITVDGVHWLAARRGGGVAGAACLTSAAGRMWGGAAARILEASSSRNSPTEYGPPGLANTSTAPRLEACMAVWQDACARGLITLTGLGDRKG